MLMSVITATIDLGSIFAVSISGIFIVTFCPRVGFWNFLEEVASIFFFCSSSPSLAASRNTFTFWALLIVAVLSRQGFQRLLLGFFFYFELRSPLPLLCMFLLHLYYHYLAIPYQELVRGQSFSFIELCKINYRQNILKLHVQWIIKS